MIEQLYEPFRFWSQSGSIYILSDLHLNDRDCKYMDVQWISAEEQINILKSTIHLDDTFICLGDVGDVELLWELWYSKCPLKFPIHTVLITGNHDTGKVINNRIWNEVYRGPIFISSKILLSHEPVYGLDWCMNIHGHDHRPENKGDANHLNVAANVVGYKPIDLRKEIVKHGLLSGIKGIHRYTIDSIISES